MNRDFDLQKVQSLEHGEHCFIHMLEEGGAEVWRIHDVFLLFEIPQYGGYPIAQQTWNVTNAKLLVDEVYTWT